MAEKPGAIAKMVAWQKEHISDRQMTLILAFVIGLLASVAGFFLHSIVHEIQMLLTSGFEKSTYNLLFLLFPIVGIYLTSLFIKYVVRDNISHGITRVLYAISTKQSKLKGHNCWSSVVASGITIGFGGSVGAEAPIVLTGSAIGSNLGQIFRMDKKTMILLVGCGASAAIAGIFKAPIAGLVFTLEVLMVDLSMASLLPILISCVTATCFSYILMGEKSLFDFTLTDPWELDRVPACILLGVFCGFVSLYFMRAMSACEGFFAQLKQYPYVKLLFGGIILSSLIFLFPSLYGEGYSAVNILLKGRTEADWDMVMSNSLFYGHSQLLVLYIGLVTFTKVFATSATNGSGGCGGTFAPSLFIGGFAGFFFARIWNIYKLGVYIPEQNFTLMGMAGVMTGVMHAPLTGIFLIAELTGYRAAQRKAAVGGKVGNIQDGVAQKQCQRHQSVDAAQLQRCLQNVEGKDTRQHGVCSFYVILNACRIALRSATNAFSRERGTTFPRTAKSSPLRESRKNRQVLTERGAQEKFSAVVTLVISVQ